MQTVTILLIASIALCAYGNPSGRIVGGDDAPEGKYPYQVSLRLYGQHNCGGSILNKRYILTAAHCVHSNYEVDSSVLVGTTELKLHGTVYEVEKLIPHENFSLNGIANDVALIRVAKDIAFSDKVQPIVLQAANDVAKHDYKAVITGWGRLNAHGSIPNHLQEVSLNVISQEECKKTYNDLNDSKICTYTSFGKGVCNGDSGGPLVANGVQIGIVSYGYPCAIGYPDVYTRVSAHIDWIEKHSQL